MAKHSLQIRGKELASVEFKPSTVAPSYSLRVRGKELVGVQIEHHSEVLAVDFFVSPFSFSVARFRTLKEA
jgi:hypothetical protein